MYKEIVICTKNYIEQRIRDLNKCLDILSNTQIDISEYKNIFEYAIEELEKVRNEMLNTCDYGIWLKEHKEE